MARSQVKKMSWMVELRSSRVGERGEPTCRRSPIGPPVSGGSVSGKRIGAPVTAATSRARPTMHSASPRSRKWQLEVVGANVPQGPQDFAVVVLGASRVA